MCRILVWGLVLLVPLPAAWSQESKKDEKEIKVEGKLSPEDAKDKVMTKSPHQVHTVKMKAGQMYQIDLVSRAFDAFLRVEDASGKELASDDDSGGSQNSRIYFKVPADGSYRLIVTSFDGGAGAYTLTAKAGSGATLAAKAALSAAQHIFQFEYQAALAAYLKAPTDEAKDKVLAGMSAQMDDLAERFAKVAKEYPDEIAGKQAALLAKQKRAMIPSIKGTLMFAAAEKLRDDYEKAYEAKAKDADALYQQARSCFAEGVKKNAGKNGLANQFKEALYMLENLAIGKAAPEIEAEDLDGKAFKLSDYRGKVVVIDFWGNW